MAVSVDPPEKLNVTREATKASFDFLSDPEGKLLDVFGVRHENGGMDGDIAQSASFLLDADGKLVWKRVAENYRVRPRPAEIFAAADSVLGSR